MRPADRKGRTDLTHLPLVTIDGETAKDFDDAVYCEPDGRGFRLIVAIADVSHYVRDGDALDGDARERGTSVYFPRRVIPMLPEALSNELCSLKPAVDRLCMACDMRIDARGAITSYTFYPAAMHSRARLTYTQVYQWLTEPGTAKAEPARALLPHLAQLYTLYKVLFAARERRGAIDFDTVELALEFDEHGKIVRIVPAPRNDAHKLIEECMLAANVCAADFLAKHEQPALYRMHEGRRRTSSPRLREFLGGSALTLTGGDEPTATDYATLHRPHSRSARFRAAADGAAALAVSRRNTAPTTSAISASPTTRTRISRRRSAAIPTCSSIARSRRCSPASATRRRTRRGRRSGCTARRPSVAPTTRRATCCRWLKCFYMQDKVGETFTGTISGVASFGLFVTLDGLNIDGLVHVTELPRDYFHFDAVRHALIGERSGRVFQLAARVSVKVARVDLERAKIDFTLDEAALVPRRNR